MEASGSLTTAQARAVLKELLDVGRRSGGRGCPPGLRGHGRRRPGGRRGSGHRRAPLGMGSLPQGEDKLSGFFIGHDQSRQLRAKPTSMPPPPCCAPGGGVSGAPAPPGPPTQTEPAAWARSEMAGRADTASTGHPACLHPAKEGGPGRRSADATPPAPMIPAGPAPYGVPMASDMKPRSREVTDGYERAPARAMLRAIGMTDDDWDKPQVGRGVFLERGHALQPPARPPGQAGQGGRPGRRRLPDRVRDHRRVRRHLDGRRGHAGLAGEPGGHRRLGRDGHARRALRCHGDPGGMRQVVAGHADGRRPPQPAGRLPLRRQHPARAGARAARPSTS